MSASHGMPSRAAANGTSGAFGRMFPQLAPRRATGLERALEFGAPGGLMDGGQTGEDQLAPDFPAGFTFLGQFIDHDLTLDVLSQLGGRDEPSATTDFRTPRLDLDNLYGAGPVVSPHLYDGSREGRLAHTPDGVDLARTLSGLALIGDPRNDENLLLSQFHLVMAKFHNAVVDRLAGGEITDAFSRPFPEAPGDEPRTQQHGVPLEQLLDVANHFDSLFASARQLVRWHYQWIVLHEFLPMVGDAKVVADVVENGPRYFRPEGAPFIPVEFAAAAFRFGHSTVRSGYQVNRDFFGKIFPDDPDASPSPRTDLRGGRPVLPEHTVDWRLFFEVSREVEPQPARHLAASLNTRLLDLPVSAVPGAVSGALARPVASLAVRNLLRSETLGLPAGQDVARAIGEIPLTDEELGTTGPVYLWYYVLKEAEVVARGHHLGPVGTRIVTEVLVALLDADPASFRSVFPRWRPTLGEKPGRFEVADLLYVAGAVG
ncbi:heme peroxidase family protein [Streptomyces sp. NPDC059740]|uniref:peroxidase family protein n=1 Tax=Streptomyces sp. NPDC059740 TaxID=3346926 RepID=UPI00365C4C9E